ncbi:ABC transporter permease [Bacillus thuringiensis]|nr:ABC transporter permease [Bacillus thuringiensis]MRB61429.1 ABC transporter permease [Bacillus thuringiensis]
MMKGSEKSIVNAYNKKDKKYSGVSQEFSHKVPFGYVISIPKGFQLVPSCKPKMAYCLEYAGIINEPYQKMVQVEINDSVGVDLHILKVKGCISVLINIEVEPIRGQTGFSTEIHTNRIAISCAEKVCIDHAVKCSTTRFTNIDLNYRNIIVSELQMMPICDGFCYFVRITGAFQFCYM